MITQNGFQGGLNQDLSKSKIPNTNYLDATNVRLITTEGQSSGSLTNIKGNALSFTIPNTFNVYRISVNTSGFGVGNFTVDAQVSTGTFTPNANTSGQDIYDFISTDVTLTNFGTAYHVAIGDNYVIIYSQTVDTNPSFSGSGLTIVTSVPAESSLIPIGFTLLRDYIYIYTCKSTDKNPGGHDSSLPPDTSSTGQIWKLDYDLVTYTTTLTLIYNNYLDFTAYRQIATTASLGRYENIDTQRIYWTDFFNPLRSLNATNVNVMALSPQLLGVVPPVNFDIPTLQKVFLGGSIPVGVYQLAYRLKNTGGAVTNYSELSNPVNIVPADEGANINGSGFKDYIGAAQNTTTSKAITWKIGNLDTNFERVEYMIAFRDSLLGTAILYTFADEPVPASGTALITYNGQTPLATMSLGEFNALAGAFTHCKTIGSKDNILFAGNTKNIFSDISYDARAFRAHTSGGNDIYLTNNGVDDAVRTLVQAEATAETTDAINKYSDAARIGLYQPGTTKLGGKGTNISYEFGTIAVRADSTIALTNPLYGPDYRHTNPEYMVTAFDLGVKNADNLTDQVYPTNTINDDIKYVYLSGIYRGYEINETYRMAITFFDKVKNPIFAKWIGDIKMPTHTDVNDNPLFEDGTTAPHADFRSAFIDSIHVGTATAYVNQLFIKFTVAIPLAISNIIDGYTICRVERTSKDKSILGTGFLTQTIADPAQLWLPDLQATTPAGYNGNATSANNPEGGAINSGTDTYPNDTAWTLDCPEFLLGGYPGYVTGDILRIVEKYDAAAGTGAILFNGGTEPYNILKYYGQSAGYAAGTHDFTIANAGECQFGGTYVFAGSTIFNNNTRSTNNTSDAIGSKTLCVQTNSRIPYTATFGCGANDLKLIAQYVRPLGSQYGGNTYSARSNNEYIPCSHYRQIKPNTATTDTFQLFGGDVFTQVYDNQKEIKNWGQTARGQYAGAGDSKKSLTLFFPCRASHNTDLRHGDHVNYNLNNDAGNAASGDESQAYNTVYSSENNLRRFFPKPTQFTLEEENDNRVYYSATKINGELTDSWGCFKTNDYWDVEGSYGPINAIIPLDQNILFWQDYAFGNLMVNPVAIVTDNNGVATILGKGATIQRHVYTSNTVGTKHQNSIIQSNTAIYWIDIINRKAYRTTDSGFESVSVSAGMQSFFNNFILGEIKDSDNPVYHNGTYRAGITGYFDSNNNEVVYTLFDAVTVGREKVPMIKTLVFNETIGKYTSFYSFASYQYIYNGVVLYSMDSANYQRLQPITQQIGWLHDLTGSTYGKFYGTFADSYVKLLVNPIPSTHKIFDNLHLQTEEQTLDIFGTATDVASGLTPVQETYDRLKVSTDYQTTGLTTLVVDTNIKRYERYWKLAIPKDSVGSPYVSAFLKPRIRDFYATVELWYLNSGKRLITHDILTEYRQQGIPITTINTQNG